MKKFYNDRLKNISIMNENDNLKKDAIKFINHTTNFKYSHNFDWLSRPIIQYPQDIIAFQEIIWNVKPDLIIEMGIAHGGSLILSASMLALLDLCEYGQTMIRPKHEFHRRVVAVDIDIRTPNRKALEEHPFYPRLTIFEGSSVDQKIIDKVRKEAEGYENILVCLDSNHTHKHVLSELEAYAHLTSLGSYCIVFDTIIEDMPAEMFHDRPWGPGNNPKTAVRDYLKTHPEFEIDRSIQNKMLITVAPDGFLKRTK